MYSKPTAVVSCGITMDPGGPEIEFPMSNMLPTPPAGAGSYFTFYSTNLARLPRTTGAMSSSCKCFLVLCRTLKTINTSGRHLMLLFGIRPAFNYLQVVHHYRLHKTHR